MVSWFESRAGPPQSRSDTYLVLAGTDALGVKIRGGPPRFELKLRARPAEPVTLPGGVAGQREEWQRWSLSRPALTRAVPRLGLPKGRWVDVGKRRRLVTVPHRGDAGCRVELTAVTVDGREWSTLGFEAFGPDADRVPALAAAADRFFTAVALPDGFSPLISSGYPGWLATL
jgi:hypothetical protein